MKDEPDLGRPLDERKLRDSIRQMKDLQVPRDFRERLRVDFTSGRIAETPGRPKHAPLRPRFPVLRWLAVPALAAAAVATFVLLSGGPAWTVLEIRGDGRLTVDGRSIETRDPRELSRLVRSSSSLELSEGTEVVMLCPDVAVIELAAGTKATLPPPPRRRQGRTGEVLEGAVRIMTGPGFRGHRLAMMSPEALTEIRGTIISIDRVSPLTCVCVLEGEAWVGSDSESLERIAEGQRKVMFSDGTEPIISDVAPEHGAPLVVFAEKYRAVVERGRTGGSE